MSTYRFYKYSGQDPIIAKALSTIKDPNMSAAARRTGVSASTLYNWRSKKSKRTFTNTLNAVLRGNGKKLDVVDL